MSYKWPGIPNGDYSFDHGRAVWNKIINYLRRLSEKLDSDIVDATADRRGMMTAADKAALDAVPETFETQSHAASTYETKANAVVGLSASGTTVTYTKGDGTTGTFETQDHDTIYTHPTYTPRTGKPAQDQTPGFGDAVTVSQIKSDSTGHVTEATDRTITIPATEASRSAAGLMSATDKSKLDDIATGAEVNQDAFSNVKVGTTTVAADSKTDTIELVAGTGITLTPDATNDKVTIKVTDNTYAPTSHTHSYLSLSGGTMTGAIKVGSLNGTWIGALAEGNALLSRTDTTGFGAWLNGYTKEYKVALSTYPNSNNLVYLYSQTKAAVTAGTPNATYKQLTWNAGTGDLGVDSINGFTLGKSVPSNAIFTDTVTTVETSGSGNAVTSVTASNGALTVKKDNTFSLSNHTHNYAGSSSAGGAANSLLNFTSGLNGVAEHDANKITTNGHWYYTSNGPSTSLGASVDNGALYTQAYSANWVAQIAQDYRNGNLFVRGRNNGTWKDWQAIATVTVNGANVLKFANGKQFVFQSVSPANVNAGATLKHTVTLSRAFKDTEYKVILQHHKVSDDAKYGKINYFVRAQTTTTFDVIIVNNSTATVYSPNLYCLALGEGA